MDDRKMNDNGKGMMTNDLPLLMENTKMYKLYFLHFDFHEGTTCANEGNRQT